MIEKLELIKKMRNNTFEKILRETSMLKTYAIIDKLALDSTTLSVNKFKQILYSVARELAKEIIDEEFGFIEMKGGKS